MKKYTIVSFLLLLNVTDPALAEPIPSYALDKDYENCLGDDKNDFERQAYCNCVRDGMREWDLETYGNIAMDHLKTGKPPAQIEQLAKGCVDKVLK